MKRIKLKRRNEKKIEKHGMHGILPLITIESDPNPPTLFREDLDQRTQELYQALVG
jgi:hypothetical protein